MRSSQTAVDLIVEEEVSSSALYTKLYSGFSWPGGASGPTVGIGYDTGYTTPDEILRDWAGLINSAGMAQLVIAQGKKSATAAVFVSQNKNSVVIPWSAAYLEFQNREIPKWEQKLAFALPNTDSLTADSFGALVSLIYNRGTGGFTLPGERYSEMRAIKACMANKLYDKIPAQIRSMKRLWTNGLVTRREREAALFERGLAVAKGRMAPPLLTRAQTVLRQATTVGTATGASIGGAAFFVAPPHYAQWIAPLAFAITGVVAACASLRLSRHRLSPRADP